MILGLLLGEYSKHATATLFVFAVGVLTVATLDETGFAFAGTIRRLTGGMLPA